MDFRNFDQDFTDVECTDIEMSVAFTETIGVQNETPRPNTRIHSAVWKSLGFFFFGILAVFALAFRSSPQTLFMLAICVIYLAMYLSGPLLVMRTAGETLDDGTPLAEFLDRPFSTFTGLVTGRQAWFQICIIPGALFLTAIGMGLVTAFTL